MRFRKTLTFLMLVTALVFARPAWAQQKSVGASGAGPRPNAVRPYVACAAAGLTPPGVRQKFVAPTLRLARADVAASLPRHGGVKPPLRYAALTGGPTTATSAKPFTQEQVVSMVREGFGDESGAKLIEQRGIDFTPSDDFYQTLKTAGASEAFLKALRAAKPPEPASTKKPLNQVQVFALLADQVPSHRVTMLVQERGIDFEPTDDYLQEVRLAGGEDELISALSSAKVTKPTTVDPAAQARQAEVRQHVARGAELKQKGQYAEAEQEYRAALLFDPHNPDVYDSLAYVLFSQKKWDDAASAAREAIRLDPNSDTAHVQLGLALGSKGDVDGEIAEYHEALRLNPNNDLAHFNLGSALVSNGDWHGAIGEYREALRLDPNDAAMHYLVGTALEGKGDRQGALKEYRTAHQLLPEYGPYREAYERLSQQGNQ